MATLTFISLNSLSSTTAAAASLTRTHRPLSSHPSKSTLSILHSNKKSSRGLSVITRGGPTTTTYIFAFLFPASLLAVTIFTSMRIADELDQKFLEELAVNQEILDTEEADGDSISSEEKSAVPRKRNRPKKEVEASS